MVRTPAASLAECAERFHGSASLPHARWTVSKESGMTRPCLAGLAVLDGYASSTTEPAGQARLQAALQQQWAQVCSAAQQASGGTKAALRKLAAAISTFLSRSAGLLTIK